MQSSSRRAWIKGFMDSCTQICSHIHRHALKSTNTHRFYTRVESYSNYMWEKITALYWCLWTAGIGDHQVNKLSPVYEAKFTKRTLNTAVDFTQTYRAVFGFISDVVIPHCVWMTLSSSLTDCCDPCCWQRTRPNLSAAHHLITEIISNYTPAIFDHLHYERYVHDGYYKGSLSLW